MRARIIMITRLLDFYIHFDWVCGRAMRAPTAVAVRLVFMRLS
jgi:hypothetical protein